MGAVLVLLTIYRSWKNGSVATALTTTCCSARATCRCAPASGPWRSPLHGPDARRDERRHRVELPYLTERDHLDRPHRHGGPAADRLLRHLSRCVGLRRSDRAVLRAASRPASSNVCRTAPTSKCAATRTAAARVSGRSGSREDEQLGSGGSPGSGSFLHADPSGEDAVLDAAHHAAERRALTALRPG